jgi:hypothetical protein
LKDDTFIKGRRLRYSCKEGPLKLFGYFLALLLFLHLYVPHALAAHGSLGNSDSDGVDQQETNAPVGQSTVLTEAPAVGDGGGDGSKKGGKKPGGDAGGQDSGVPKTFPLFIFVDATNKHPDRNDPNFNDLTPALFRLIKQKIPDAKTIEVKPVDLAHIENAWNDSKLKEQLGTSLPSSTLIIVNGLVKPAEKYQLLLDTVTVDDVQLGNAIQKLAFSIKKSKGLPSTGDYSVDTILLTSYAGMIDCRKFPGHIFGLTTTEEKRDSGIVNYWFLDQEKNRQVLFPWSAKEWFDSWIVTTQKARSGYFLCPILPANQPGRSK